MWYVTKGTYKNVISGPVLKAGREANKTISQNLFKPVVLLK